MFRDTRLKSTCILASLFVAGYIFGNLDRDVMQPGPIAAWLAGSAQFVVNILHAIKDYGSNVLSEVLLFADDVHKYPLLTVAALIGIGIQIVALRKPVPQRAILQAESTQMATVAVPDPAPQTALSQLPALAPKRQAERNAEDEAMSTAPAIPRVLLNNPYDKKIEYLTFEERVQIAVQASVRKGRVIGVIYFHLDFTPRAPIGAQAITTGEDVILLLAAELEKQLRATDCVKCVSTTEIAVFVSLISDSSQLNSVTQRLSATLTRLMSANETVSAQISQGSVLYPMGGYSSVELVASAHHKAKLTAANQLLGAQEPIQASINSDVSHSLPLSNRSGTTVSVN